MGLIWTASSLKSWWLDTSRCLYSSHSPPNPACFRRLSKECWLPPLSSCIHRSRKAYFVDCRAARTYRWRKIGGQAYLRTRKYWKREDWRRGRGYWRWALPIWEGVQITRRLFPGEIIYDCSNGLIFPELPHYFGNWKSSRSDQNFYLIWF